MGESPKGRTAKLSETETQMVREFLKDWSDFKNDFRTIVQWAKAQIDRERKKAEFWANLREIAVRDSVSMTIRAIVVAALGLAVFGTSYGVVGAIRKVIAAMIG